MTAASKILLILAAAFAPAAAAAQTPLEAAVFARSAATAKPAPAAALAYARRAGDGPSVFAKTSVAHRFSEDGPVGQVGYLCGIKPFAPDNWGVSAGPASGFERGLTFLGVKLDYPFR